MVLIKGVITIIASSAGKPQMRDDENGQRGPL